MNANALFIADARPEEKRFRGQHPEATFIPMSAIFPIVTDAYRSAEAVNKNAKLITAILRV